MGGEKFCRRTVEKITMEIITSKSTLGTIAIYFPFRTFLYHLIQTDTNTKQDIDRQSDEKRS